MHHRKGMQMRSSTYRLTRLHHRIDDAIRSELRRALPDAIRLLRLKSLRLAIKARLAGGFGRMRTA